MNIVIESFLIAVIAVVTTLCFTKLSFEWYTPELSWKAVGALSLVVIAVFEIVYWAFIN